MSHTLQFGYVPAEQARHWWETLLDEADGPLLHQAHLRLARALVHEWHGDHLGILPPEAAWLTRILFFPADVDRPPSPWALVCARLEALRGAQNEGDAESQEARAARGVLLPARNPQLSLIRLLKPLWQQAQQAHGETFLFCEDDDPALVAEARLTAYRERMNEHLQSVSAAEATRGLFEETLWLLLDETPRSQPSRRLDPLGTRLLAALEPVLPPAPPILLNETRRRPRQATRKVRDRSEEGYAGIHMTRRLQDMGNVLFSEFMQHRMVATDRLVNTGYLAYQRTPKRERTHRTHVACVLPTMWLAPAQAAFVRACWLEAVVRFAYHALAHDRPATVFQTAFYDEAGVVAHHGTALADLDLSAWRTLPQPAFRREFLNRTGWPSFLFDVQHGCTAQRLPSLDASNALVPELVTALRRFWKTEPATRTHSVTQQRLLVLPEPLRERGPTLIRDLLAGPLPKSGEAAVLWVPQSRSGLWLMESVVGGEAEPVAPADADFQRLAGRLMQHWLAWWKKERHGG